MPKQHHYQLTMTWTGNRGEGTVRYDAYDRDHKYSAPGKPDIPGSSDPSFRGDKTRYNPEELLVASLSSCHMLWFLHLCAVNGIVVTDYVDNAAGVMEETADGGGRFVEVVLKPAVTVADRSMIGRVDEMHYKANQLCFIANSVNFRVSHEGSCESAD